MVLGSEADIPSNLLPLRLLLIYRPKEEGKPGVSISKLIIIVRLMILLMGPYMLLLQQSVVGLNHSSLVLQWLDNLKPKKWILEQYNTRDEKNCVWLYQGAQLMEHWKQKKRKPNEKTHHSQCLLKHTPIQAGWFSDLQQSRAFGANCTDAKRALAMPSLGSGPVGRGGGRQRGERERERCSNSTRGQRERWLHQLNIQQKFLPPGHNEQQLATQKRTVSML